MKEPYIIPRLNNANIPMSPCAARPVPPSSPSWAHLAWQQGDPAAAASSLRQLAGHSIRARTFSTPRVTGHFCCCQHKTTGLTAYIKKKKKKRVSSEGCFTFFTFRVFLGGNAVPLSLPCRIG